MILYLELSSSAKLLWYAINEAASLGVCKMTYKDLRANLGISSIPSLLKELEGNNLISSYKDGAITISNQSKERGSYNKFLKWMQVNTPNVMSLNQITEEQYLVLAEKFDKDLIVSKLLAMENTVGLKKKYNSSYLTLSNWCKMEIDRTGKGKRNSIIKTGLKGG